MAVWVDPKARYTIELDGVTFSYRLLTAREYATVSDLLRRDPSGEWFTNYHLYRLQFLKFCLVGWEGGAVPFTKGPDGYVTDECLDHLHYSVRTKLSQQIDAAHTMTEDDAGKSPSS